MDDDPKDHIIFRVHVSRAYHGVHGDSIIDVSGTKITMESVNLDPSISAGIGVEMQARH